jgi:hypothetical protein
MTEEELREHLRKIRHNRNFAKPAAAAHVKRAVKKGSQGRVSKAEDLFTGLSTEEKLALIAQLQGN